MENYKSLIRLYVPTVEWFVGAEVALSVAQAHYLKNVMRRKTGDFVRLFNGHDGEWLGTLGEVKKNIAFVRISEKIGAQASGPDIWVLASPVKKEAFEIMIEKAAELDAAVFQPVICEHTVVRRIREERLQAISIEAAEQCERCDVMPVRPAQDLKQLLQQWPADRKLIFCQERGAAPALVRQMMETGLAPPLAILIGPEGGFSTAETAFIAGLPFAVPVSLGARILRAETAMIAALACIQAWLARS